MNRLQSAWAGLSLARFTPDAQLLLMASGIFSVSFMGVQMLLKILYLIRLDYSLTYIGIFSATSSLAYSLMSLPSGALGSRFGNRTVMLIGGVITILGMALLPWVEFVPAHLHTLLPLVSQVLVSGGWALFNVSLVPALMTVTTRQNRNRAFALNSTLRGLGAFVGTMVGGLLPSFFALLLSQTLAEAAPYRYALWVGALLGLLGLAPILRMRRVTYTVQQDDSDESAAPFPIWPMALLILHVYFGNSSVALCQTFCSAYMDTDLHLSTAFIGFLTGIGQFVAIFAPLLAPRIAARFGNGRILMVATLGAALSMLPLTFGHDWASAGMGRLGLLVLSAIWQPALQVFQMELVASRWRSLAYGIMSMGMSLTFTSVSFGGGYVATQWGYQTLFLLGVGLSTAGALLMWAMLRGLRRQGRVI
ncbi:MAG: MFS transporter [Caldilineaceae bacterium]